MDKRSLLRAQGSGAHLDSLRAKLSEGSGVRLLLSSGSATMRLQLTQQQDAAANGASLVDGGSPPTACSAAATKPAFGSIYEAAAGVTLSSTGLMTATGADLDLFHLDARSLQSGVDVFLCRQRRWNRWSWPVIQKPHGGRHDEDKGDRIGGNAPLRSRPRHLTAGPLFPRWVKQACYPPVEAWTQGGVKPANSVLPRVTLHR